MPSRPRLILKKRGTRRTGARWPGLLAEALLFLALIAAGGYGLYWLVGAVLLAEGASYGWWLWLTIIIPVAFIGFGATELVLLLWKATSSTERRSAVVRKATDWDIPVGPSKADPFALPSVPSMSVVTDSPGTRLAYRLPIDAASGWVSFTMAAVCIVWNSFVAIFVYRVIQQHLQAQSNRWLLTWLIVPFLLAGIWTLVALVRHVVLQIIIGTTRIEVSGHPFYPGGTFHGFVSQSGRSSVRWFKVQLACDEQAVYQQGTDSRRAITRVYNSTAFSQRKFEITPQQAFETEFNITVPESAMHSFVSIHNAVVWSLVVRGRMARWGEFERRFPVFIYPAQAVEHSSSAPLAAAARR